MTEPLLEAQKRLWNEALHQLEAEMDENRLLEPLRALAAPVNQRLPEMVRKLREGGYRFATDLEQKLAELTRRFTLADDELRREAQSRLRDLAWRRDDLVRMYHSACQLNAPGTEHQIQALIAGLGAVRSEIPRLREMLQSRLADIHPLLQELQRRGDEIERTLKRGLEANFSFLPNEHLFLALEAEWRKGASARENPDGWLYVTDQRLVMERREKEGGFLGIGGHKVQEVVWEIPWSEVETITAEQQGLLGGIDLIHILPKPGANFSKTSVEIKGGLDAHETAARLKAGVDGSFARLRGV